MKLAVIIDNEVCFNHKAMKLAAIIGNKVKEVKRRKYPFKLSYILNSYKVVA